MSGMPLIKRKKSLLTKVKLQNIQLALCITDDLLIKSATLICQLNEKSFNLVSKYLSPCREEIDHIPSIIFEARWEADSPVDHVLLDLAMAKIANPSKFKKITTKLQQTYEKLHTSPPAGSPRGTTAAIFASTDHAATKPSDTPSP